MTPVHDTWLGGCLCGRVRYRAEGTPADRTHCHCETCRRSTGAPFVSWATFPASGFSFTAGHPARFDSSEAAYRQFCANCGTQLTFTSRNSPDGIDVTLGSLDRPESIMPSDHIWTRRQLSWIRLADGLPRFAGDRTPA